MESLSRPTSPSSSSDHIRDWIEWFGLSRLVVSALAVVVVCAGVFWLVRTPPPPTEASLPRAVATSVPEPSLPAVNSGVATTGADFVAVHVAGAVLHPGVYELEANGRVQDAVEAAGGLADDADPNALNLAAVVVDGSRVYVPAVGEVVPTTDLSVSGDEQIQAIVDVNRASALELESLPGIGPVTAAAIITERDNGGPFIDVDALQRVPGIGPAKLELLRDRVTT